MAADVSSASGLSVLTLVKNRPTHLHRMVEGLARSTVPPCELVVVDMSDHPVVLPDTPFPSRSIRLHTGGLPLAEARNLAADRSRGERLLFLDVDCIPAADLIDRMDTALAANDALICAEVRYLGAGAVQDGWTEADLMTRGQVHPVRDFPASGLRQEQNAGLFWSLAFGIRRTAFDALGGFDPRFTGYGAEDTDFGFRARDAGLPLLFMAGTGAFHQHHGVFDPPLQHFRDILKNAETFQRVWGHWPMTGWLTAFEAMGLIAIHADRIETVREPTAREIKAACKPKHAPF